MIKIYTDGSCLENPGGPGGWAAIIKLDPAGEIHLAGGDPSTTNNRMEMMGVIRGLECIEPTHHVVVYTDSDLVVKCASGRWKVHANLDLWKRLHDAANRHGLVEWQWIRGHNGDPDNELADEIAGREARRFIQQEKYTNEHS